MLENTLRAARNLIGQSHLDEAFKLLTPLAESASPALRDQLIGLRHNHTQAQRDRRLNLVSNEESGRAFARTAAGLLEFCQQLIDFQNLPTMTPVEIAKAATSYILPFLKKSKLIEQIGDDFSEAISNELQLLWKKVKPIFIEDFNDGSGKLDEYAENQAAVEKAIAKSAKDEAFAAELKAVLAKLEEKSAAAGIQITNSSNVIAGVQHLHVGGDLVFGSKNDPKP